LFQIFSDVWKDSHQLNDVLVIGLILTLTEDWASDPANELCGMKYVLVNFWVVGRVNFQTCVRKLSCRRSTLSALDSKGWINDRFPIMISSERAEIPTHYVKYSKQIFQLLSRLFGQTKVRIVSAFNSCYFWHLCTLLSYQHLCTLLSYQHLCALLSYQHFWWQILQMCLAVHNEAVWLCSYRRKNSITYILQFHSIYGLQ
jgi:hypothetical protein